MVCRCEEMRVLLEKINKLNQIQQKSQFFLNEINNSKDEQRMLKEDVYTATKSTTLNTKMNGYLPKMTEQIEEAHTELEKEIKKARCEIKKRYDELENEDIAYHAEG